MVNLMKWDLINVWQKTKGYVIFALILAAVTVIFPKDVIVGFVPGNIAETVMSMYPILAALIFIVFFISGVVYIVFKMTSELRKKTCPLEITVDRKPWEIVLSKMFVNVILLLLLLLAGGIFEFIMKKFSTSNLTFFSSIFEGQDYLYEIIGITFSAINIYFAYILSRSINFTRKNPIVWTIIILILFSVMFSYVEKGVQSLLGYDYDLAKMIEFSNVSTEDGVGAGIKIDGEDVDIQAYENIQVVREGICILLFYFGSCKLLEKRFDV